jgi:hypothetical protein
VSRLRRVRRSSARDVTGHERATRLAAQRLDGSLPSDDRAWLDGHLAACRACRAVAVSYEADRAALRSLRDVRLEPPRDLWARTSAAIEQESGARRRAARGGGARRMPALGVLSGVAVIAVVIGATVLSGGFLDRPPTIATVPSASTPPVAVATRTPIPRATPMTVGAGSVGWIGTGADGRFAYNIAAVDEVCPPARDPDCAPVAGQEASRVDLTVRPKSVARSPVRDEAVVVSTDADGEDAVFVISLPKSGGSATPTAAPTPKATTPAGTPSPETAAPTAETTPDASTDPSATPASSARPTQPATPTPEPTPVVTPDPTTSPEPTPEVTPEPTTATSLAIASGVKVVGESAAYSPDGAWFAFTARPSDDSSGPDIYLWRVGDDEARKLTDDHASVFASWAGDRLVGSRPAITDPAAAEVTAQSFLLDPETGRQTELEGSAWRPVIDPNGDWALTWDGTIRIGSDGLSLDPGSGSLAIRPYEAGVGIETAPGAGSVVTDERVAGFDARWDESGRWLAIWVADRDDPSYGRLSLHRIDPASGELERPDGAPKDVIALPGFSMREGRLAWATPPGQGGEGSRVQIVAWSEDAVGAVESGPVEDVVVIH